MLKAKLLEFINTLKTRIEEVHKEQYDINVLPTGLDEFFIDIHINGVIYQSFWIDLSDPNDPHWMMVYDF